MAYIGKSPSGAGVRSRFFYTQSTAGATSISGTDDDNRTLTFSDAEYVDVFLNGSLLAKGDYTAASNTISSLAALASGDIVEVVVYDIFTVADTVSASAGGTFSANVSFTDNSRAIFGAGNDLQIYHNSSNNRSYIIESGSGSFIVQGENLILEDTSGNNYIQANAGSDVQLYHNGSEKLATTSSGVDVTGSVTADGLDLGTTTDASTVSNTASDYQLQLGAAQSTTGDIGRNISFDVSGTTTAAINTIDAGTGNAQSLAFFTGNSTSIAERMAIDSIGRVGIGRTPTAYGSFQVLDVAGSSGAIQKIIHTGSSVELQAYASSTLTGIGSATNHPLIFTTNDTERMRISASSGDVHIGTTASIGPAQLNLDGGTQAAIGIRAGNGTSGYFNQVLFANSSNSALIGSIQRVNNASIQYNTTSDARLKENIADMTGAIARVKQLAPKRYSWVNEDLDAADQDGFLAHETQAVVPMAVSGTQDEVDSDGNPLYMQMDYSKLVPLLTGALQEAIAKIETLEAKVTALENAS